MYRVIVADDEILEQKAVKSILEKSFSHTLQIETALNGIEAVDKAKSYKANIAILDIEMPGMNGLEASKYIKESLPDCRIILLTAYGVFDYAQEAIRLGVKDYILKPAQDEEIVEVIDKVLEQLDKENVNAIEDALIINDKNSKIMKRVEEYIHKNYMKDISLDHVASMMNFNPFYFSKLFKNHFGVNFIDYLASIRIDTAKQLLLDPFKSAKEVGRSVGYSDSNYFTKIFKKKTGLTPTEYRNK